MSSDETELRPFKDHLELDIGDRRVIDDHVAGASAGVLAFRVAATIDGTPSPHEIRHQAYTLSSQGKAAFFVMVIGGAKEALDLSAMLAFAAPRVTFAEAAAKVPLDLGNLGVESLLCFVRVSGVPAVRHAHSQPQLKGLTSREAQRASPASFGGICSPPFPLRLDVVDLQFRNGLMLQANWPSLRARDLLERRASCSYLAP